MGSASPSFSVGGNLRATAFAGRMLGRHRGKRPELPPLYLAPKTVVTSLVSEQRQFETDDESFAVDDAEVGASCFFDDVCNTGVAEKRRHLALDGGMEEMRRRIERMEVSLREGGIVPA